MGGRPIKGAAVVESSRQQRRVAREGARGGRTHRPLGHRGLLRGGGSAPSGWPSSGVAGRLAHPGNVNRLKRSPDKTDLGDAAAGRLDAGQLPSRRVAGPAQHSRAAAADAASLPTGASTQRREAPHSWPAAGKPHRTSDGQRLDQSLAGVAEERSVTDRLRSLDHGRSRCRVSVALDSNSSRRTTYSSR